MTDVKHGLNCIMIVKVAFIFMRATFNEHKRMGWRTLEDSNRNQQTSRTDTDSDTDTIRHKGTTNSVLMPLKRSEIVWMNYNDSQNPFMSSVRKMTFWWVNSRQYVLHRLERLYSWVFLLLLFFCWWARALVHGLVSVQTMCGGSSDDELVIENWEQKRISTL